MERKHTFRLEDSEFVTQGGCSGPRNEFEDGEIKPIQWLKARLVNNVGDGQGHQLIVYCPLRSGEGMCLGTVDKVPCKYPYTVKKPVDLANAKVIGEVTIDF